MKNQFSKLFLSTGVNYFSDDKPLKVFLKFFNDLGNAQLEELGRYVSNELIEVLYEIDRGSSPVIHHWGTEGERIDYVRLSQDHRRALQKLQELGVVNSIFLEPESMMQHFLSGYIISDSGIFCTMTLTAQTAYAIDKYGSEELKKKFLGKFLEQQDPWYGATYYTEIQGGSDLGANVTSAVEKGGAYLLNGPDKYFASNAGIADAAIVTARFGDSPNGAKGISTFLVPSHRDDGTPNYLIRRLKTKLGTIAVPTGEVEFTDSEAYILGSREIGIYIAMEILAISRIDDAIAAVGIARKSLWEALLYSTRRKAFGNILYDFPLMKRDLVEMESELEASLVLSLLAASKFNNSKKSRPPYDLDYHYARLLSNVSKNYASRTSTEITRYSMELMGGIGFLEEFPVAKFHRDSIVTSIWEGTSNIQALEFLEVLGKKGVKDMLISDLADNISKVSNKELSEALSVQMEGFRSRLHSIEQSSTPEFHSKALIEECGILLAATYLCRSGEGTDDSSRAVLEIARIFLFKHFNPAGIQEIHVSKAEKGISWMKR